MNYEMTSTVLSFKSGTEPNNSKSDPISSTIISSNLWIDFPLLESECVFERSLSSVNWTFWTIWDETLLKYIYPWLNMSPGVFYITSLRKLEMMVKEGFSRITKDEFNYTDNVIVVKVLRQAKEPFRPISETTCLEVMEYKFMEKRVAIEPTPMELIACSGLADILRTVYRNSDILMIRGTFSRVAISDNSGNERNYLLVNASAACGEIQIIRLTFRDDATTALVEEIKPRPQRNRYVFKYTAVIPMPPNGITTRRTSIWHQTYKWQNSKIYDISDRQRTSCEGTLAEFDCPITAQQDAIFAYRKLLDKVCNCNFNSVTVCTPSILREERTSQTKKPIAPEAATDEPHTCRRLFVYLIFMCFVIIGLIWMIRNPSKSNKCPAAVAHSIFLIKADNPTATLI